MHTLTFFNSFRFPGFKCQNQCYFHISQICKFACKLKIKLYAPEVTSLKLNVWFKKTFEGVKKDEKLM